MIFWFPSPEPVLLRPLFSLQPERRLLPFLYPVVCRKRVFSLSPAQPFLPPYYLLCGRCFQFPHFPHPAAVLPPPAGFPPHCEVRRFRGKGLTLLVLAFIYFGHDFAVVFGILAKNFRIDIIVVALGVFGKVVIAFDQVKRGAADFAGNGIAVKFIIEGVDRTVAAVIAAAAVFVVCFFHIYTIKHQVKERLHGQEHPGTNLFSFQVGLETKTPIFLKIQLAFTGE